MRYLEGVRVLDLTQFLPGPYCTMLLSDLGADVTKIERPDGGDPSRDLMPGLYWSANRGKKSITLDLKSENSQDIVKKMIKDVDVLIEGFRPGVMEKLGLGYEKVKEVNPSVIYCSVSGFGQSGPYRTLSGHDVNYLSVAGALGIPGDIEFPPVRPGIPVGDLSASMFAATSILASLHRRSKTGQGDYLDVSITDTVFSWTSMRLGDYFLTGHAPQTVQDFESLTPTNKTFETKDGRKIALGLVEEKFWIEFCHVAGVPEWLKDPHFNQPIARKEHYEEVLKSMKDLIKSHSSSEWAELLKGTDVPWTLVNRPTDLMNDPHIQARGLIANVDKGKQVRYPVKVESPDSIREPSLPPQLGQHTHEVLRELGYSEEEIRSFKEKRII